ncbi:MAG: hypothetical protein GEV03_21255 [Streptosporangiales bacterium]|nr:hypothetical protein [Streptosporangiales bacterium]
MAAVVVTAVGATGMVSAGADTARPAPAAQQSSTKGNAASQAVAGNPYTPKEVCGSGYYVVKDKGGIGGKAKRPVFFPNKATVWGYVYLMYNDSTGKNCVATIKTEKVGKKTYMFAALRVKGKSWKADDGTYKYYAGPVKKKAAGKCVKYRGFIDLGGGFYATGGREKWGNCG